MMLTNGPEAKSKSSKANMKTTNKHMAHLKQIRK